MIEYKTNYVCPDTKPFTRTDTVVPVTYPWYLDFLTSQ